MSEELTDLIEQGRIEDVARLLETGTAVDKGLDNLNRQIIHLAAFAGNRGVIDLALEAGADIDARDSNGTTALHLAAGYASPELVQYLLDRGAALDLRDRDGSSALERAIFRGQEDTAVLLEKKGLEPSKKALADVLLQAAGWNELAAVRLALRYGADVDSSGYNSETALHKAAAKGNLDIVELLLDAGADVFKATGTHMRAVELARSNGHEAVVQRLEQHAESQPRPVVDDLNSWRHMLESFPTGSIDEESWEEQRDEILENLRYAKFDVTAAREWDEDIEGTEPHELVVWADMDADDYMPLAYVIPSSAITEQQRAWLDATEGYAGWASPLADLEEGAAHAVFMIHACLGGKMHEGEVFETPEDFIDGWDWMAEEVEVTQELIEPIYACWRQYELPRTISTELDVPIVQVTVIEKDD